MKKFKFLYFIYNMTIFSHMETINISTLKAYLSESLKKVRSGISLTVVDRDVLIAEIIPYNKKILSITKPVKKFYIPDINLKNLPDPMEFLLEDRSK